MADTDRELALRITADAAQAKAELESLKTSTDGVVASQTQTAASATAATGAIAGEGAAAAATGGAMAGQAGAAAELAGVQLGVATSAANVVAQESAVVVALTEARAAFIALAAAGAVGSAEWTAAMGRTAIAVAGVNAEIQAARLSGGIVTAAQTAAADSYTGRLAAMVPALGQVGVATAATSAEKRLFSAATTQASNAMTGATVSAGALGGSLLRMIGPIGLVAAGGALLPTILKAWDNATKAVFDSIVTLVTGISDEDVAVAKLDKSTREAVASADLFVAAHRKGIDASHDFTTQINELGFKIRDSFDSVRQRAQDFVSAYTVILKTEGGAAAKDFAELNATAITSIIDRYAVLGKAVPSDLRNIATELGIVSDKEKELAANRDLSKKWADEMSAANLLIGVVRSSINAKEDEAAVVGKLRAQILDEIKALESLKTTNAAQEADRKVALASLIDLAVKHGILTGKMGDLLDAATKAGAGLDTMIGPIQTVGTTLAAIAQTNIPEFISGGHSMLSMLGSIKVALNEVDAAATSAFRTGGSSQLSSGPTFGHHTSVGEPT